MSNSRIEFMLEFDGALAVSVRSFFSLELGYFVAGVCYGVIYYASDVHNDY